MRWINIETQESAGVKLIQSTLSDKSIFNSSSLDRIFAVDHKDVPINLRAAFKRAHPAQVMVFGGVTDCGKKTPLVVIPQGVKVNKEAYIDMLETKIKPWIKRQTWKNGYTWQQDGAPAHTAHLSQRWLKCARKI